MRYVVTLHTLFEEEFMEAYRGASSKKRRKALPYLQAIHRRWYYATLVENAPFSPAILMESMGAYFKEPTDKYAVAVLRTPAKVVGVDFKLLEYSLEDHPVVSDLRLLIKYCTPHIDLYESGCFTDQQAVALAESLSITDPHYASFLLELAIWMKMLTKMPSLYVQRMQPSKIAEEILEHSNEEILRDIVDAAISMTTMGLRDSIPMPEHIFTESFVRSLLTNPLETDEIFGRVFEVMGYDIEEILELGNMPVPDGMSLDNLGFDMELLSGTFVMGIVLDRFFFTPFGHFLRIIRPLYAIPFAFYEEVSDYINVCEDPEEAFVAFFAPCSSYTLTNLGLKLLNVAPTAENYFDAATVLPFEGMKNTIFQCDYSLATFVELAKHLAPLGFANGMPGKIYNFRVRLESDSSIWLHLNIPESCTLDFLYEEIARYFDLKNNGEFSFFHDKTENRFAEYPSAKRAEKTKNPKTAAGETLLSALDFEHMNFLLLIAYNQSSMFAKEPPTVRLQLERLSVKDPDLDEVYPSVGRTSKNMKLRLDKKTDWEF